MSFLTMALMFVALLIMSNASALGRLFWVVLLGYLGGRRSSPRSTIIARCGISVRW